MTWVLAAQARWTTKRPEGVPQTCLGVDVARGGLDRTAICRRYGNWFAPPLTYKGLGTNDGHKVANLIMKAHEDDAVVHIDVTGGLGASPYDILKKNQWLNIKPINNSAGAPKHLRDRSSSKLRFLNLRAAATGQRR